MKKVDMSPAAVTARLRRAAELRRLCLALMKARKASPRDRRPAQP